MCQKLAWPVVPKQLNHTYITWSTQYSHISIAASICYSPEQRSQQTKGRDSAPHDQGSQRDQERSKVWQHCPVQRLLSHVLSYGLSIKEQFMLSCYIQKVGEENEGKNVQKINTTNGLFIFVSSGHNPSANTLYLRKMTLNVCMKIDPTTKDQSLFRGNSYFLSVLTSTHHRRPLLPHSVWRSWRWEICAHAVLCTDLATLGNSLFQPK